MKPRSLLVFSPSQHKKSQKSTLSLIALFVNFWYLKFFDKLLNEKNKYTVDSSGLIKFDAYLTFWQLWIINKEASWSPVCIKLALILFTQNP